MDSWSDNTKKQYNSVLRAWTEFVAKEELASQIPTVVSLCNFLSYLVTKGLSYASVASHRAALTTFFDQLGASEMGADSRVARFMKGLFRKNPPKPRYAETWDVNTVLDYITSLGNNSALSLKELTLKLAFLLAVCSPKRVSELSALSIDNLQRSAERWTFFLDYRNKNRNRGEAHTARYESFLENPLLCPVRCLADYLKATEARRGDHARLFLSFVTFKPSQATTIARWIKEILKDAGIDSKFKAHSTRSASTSKALRCGASMGDIMTAACWSEKGNTFYKFYNREVSEPSFQDHVLAR